jgi:hypothetical protein
MTLVACGRARQRAASRGRGEHPPRSLCYGGFGHARRLLRRGHRTTPTFASNGGRGFISQLRQWQASDLIFERRFDGGHFLRAQQGLLDRRIILCIITCANLPQLCDEIS